MGNLRTKLYNRIYKNLVPVCCWLELVDRSDIAENDPVLAEYRRKKDTWLGLIEAALERNRELEKTAVLSQVAGLHCINQALCEFKRKLNGEYQEAEQKYFYVNPVSYTHLDVYKRQVLAYLMLPVYNKTRRYVTENLSVKVKNEKMVQSAARGLGTLVSLLLLIAIVVGLCWMLLPQIYTSILGLQESFSENINNLSIWLQKQLADNEALEQMVVPVYEQVTDKLETWLYDTLVPNMSMVINILSTGLLGVVTVLKNSLIGLIVMVYFLNIKDTLSAQSKKIVYSLFPLKQANRIIEEVRFTHSVFGGFITGKLLDSLIIGVICFFCMRLLRMPYVLLVLSLIHI